MSRNINSKFLKFKMADGCHIGSRKIAMSIKSRDFDEIWYTNADLELDDCHVTECENFLNSR